jgi:hypothetical protein
LIALLRHTATRPRDEIGGEEFAAAAGDDGVAVAIPAKGSNASARVLGGAYVRFE